MAEIEMTEKTCLVTGANSGIGLMTAKALAHMGAEVVLWCRSADKAEDAARTIAQETGRAPEIVLADLASFAAVRDAVATVRTRWPQIDVLVNNAGLYLGHHQQTEDGHEATWQVNHLSAYLLTRLLLDCVIASPAGRIVNVSSAAHRAARMDLARINDPASFRGWRAYADSKLGNVLFTAALARRLPPHTTVNAMHPGPVGSNFAGRDAGVLTPLMKVARPFLRTPARGAQTVVWLATDASVTGASGGYFVDERPKRPSRKARDEALQERVWTASAEAVGLPV